MELENVEVSAWKAEMCEQMVQLLTEETFCDIVLEADGLKIPAHRFILASASSVFRAMLTGDLTESKDRNVAIEGVEGRALKDLVRYFYTGNITLTSETVQSILEGSDYLQLIWVKDECEKYLMESISVENATLLYEYAERMRCTDLLDACESFLSNMFVEIAMTEHFLSWSFDILLKLIQRDDLCIEDEQNVYEACLTWIRHDKEHREKHFEEIFLNIRLNQLSLDYVTNYIDDEEMVLKSTKCVKKLMDSKNFHLLPNGKKLIPARSYKQVLIVRKKPKSELLSIVLYDPLAEKWSDYDVKLNPLTESWYNCKIASWGDKIFLINGSAKLGIYDYKKSTTLRITDYFDYAFGFTTCEVENKLYFFGGSMTVRRNQAYYDYDFNGAGGSRTEPLNTIPYFCMETEAWSYVQQANRNLWFAQAVHLNGFIYLMGGRIDDDVHTNQVDRYDIKLNSWTSLKVMKVKRFVHAACTLNGKIYVAGGKDSSGKALRSVEVYAPETDEWQLLAEMNLQRDTFELIPIKNRLWAIGGGSASARNSIEIYDPISDKWTHGPTLPIYMNVPNKKVIQSRPIYMNVPYKKVIQSRRKKNKK